MEQRIEADLALGRHAELVAELETLVGQHPFRERFRHQLMLALYRSDRQADALDAYQRARRELADGLGLEPSESLKRLEAAILRQDPSWRCRRPPRRRTPRRRRWPRPPSLRERCSSPRARSSDIGRRCSRSREPLAAGEPGRELIVAGVVAADELAAATTRLAALRDELLGHGLVDADGGVLVARRRRGHRAARLAGGRRPGADGRG